MQSQRPRARAFLFALFVAGKAPLGASLELPPAGPSLEPPRALRLEEAHRALRALQTHCRLLVVAAHPDDEDTAALVATVRGFGGEAAYLSLTRGEGGQNRLGLELGEALGLIRTGELLAARQVDGAQQFFTRAIDFGFTRSLEESLTRWGMEALLADLVLGIRRFRPRVVLSVFADDPASGHGHHRAAGFLAPEALRRAEDPLFRPDLGPPWRVEALYRSGWFDPQQAEQEVGFERLDPWSGRSLAQLAWLSRSQHRSQDMGRALEMGPRSGKYRRLAGAPAAAGSLCGTEGLELERLAQLVPGEAKGAVAERLRSLSEAAARLEQGLLSRAREELLTEVGRLLEGWTALAEAAQKLDPSFFALVEEKKSWVATLWLGLHGVMLDAWLDRAELQPEGRARLELAAWNAGGSPLVLESWELLSVPGVVAELPAGPWTLAPKELFRRQIELRFDETIQPTRPYFLRSPREGDRYRWEEVDREVHGLPDGPAPLRMRWRFRGPAGSLEVIRPVVHRHVDEGFGERRRPLRVLPAVEVSFGPTPVLQLNGQPARVTVELHSNLPRPLDGALEWDTDCPEKVGGWLPVRLEPRTPASLELVLPVCKQRQRVALRYEAEGRSWNARYRVVPGAEWGPQVLPVEAVVVVEPLQVTWPRVGRVLYIPGAADRVPEALSRAGFSVEVRTAEELTPALLAQVAVVVVGSRAYEVDPYLAPRNSSLLEWVERGGVLLVQYQQYGYFSGGFPAYPLEIAQPHGRITDESSPVRVLDPGHPVFSRPNVLEPADWEGWVQERALYLPKSWDSRYEPLLELQDPGEAPERGALLVARYGKGIFVYTGLALFRQLPAGVPGAFRLFANLLALGQTSKEEPTLRVR